MLYKEEITIGNYSAGDVKRFPVDFLNQIKIHIVWKF